MHNPYSVIVTERQTDFYFTTRYPGEFPEFTWTDAEQALATAIRVEKLITEKLF
ncbi:MAG: hypothetical protein HYV32_00345 [Candidatus Kerfeldbacteria bacterium]|nr:hypothetical protein [Candidatus Kerfeldbacteria bacterium]